MLDTGFKRHYPKERKKERKKSSFTALNSLLGLFLFHNFSEECYEETGPAWPRESVNSCSAPWPHPERPAFCSGSRENSLSSTSERVEAERTVLALHQKKMYWMLQSRTRRTKLLVPAHTAILWMCEIRLVSESLSSLPLCLSSSICENGRNSVSPTRSL